MLIKALLAFLLLPMMVAGTIPVLIILFAPHHFVGYWWGRLPFSLGCLMLFMSVIAFYVEGNGTLAHWSPPKKMIRSGCYKYTRNPMYVGVILILIGESLISGSLWLLVWMAGVTIAFNYHIRKVEEPWLQKTFGEEWFKLEKDVPRWWPRMPKREQFNQ